ncbi:glycosyltransferase [Aerosakkonemataceae cyanobacterium BLCC-F154]|uniref:Glycosyltransferase n=1 Tax=Floridaenema fluviatile BLCC-F154 TaxID=3153640 RepID=A0ABV4Y8L0_9CYAN
MKITIITVGSRGDVQPYIALGVGLQNAGYTVRLATHDTFKSLIISYGLDFFPVSSDIQSITQSETGKQLIEAGGNPFTVLKRLSKAFEPIMESILKQSWIACQDADLIISGSIAFWGYDIAEKLGIPFVFASLQPIYPTKSFINPLCPPWLHLGGWVNRQSYIWISQILWQLFRNPVNRWRVETLGKPSDNQCLFLTDEWDNVQKLFGFSPSVISSPKDWNESCHVTGYWFLETPDDFEPPPGLLDFLEAGKPPIYIGFGSMASRNPEQMTTIALQALEKTQQRGILLTGWGGISNTNLPNYAFKLESIPHDWLFPKMKAIVHHGGAGTTAAALKSGIPSVVIPFFSDQPFWADRITKLGVSPTPIPKQKLTANRLANGIQKAIADNTIRQRAAQFGETIRAENGMGEAAKIIRNLQFAGGK